MRVLLGLSGGLDSTYAAHKLKSMGYDVEGAVIKMHSYTETEEARLSAESLGIPFHIINAEELFEKTVISDFVNEYKNGRTPNPCIICNSEVKFRVLYDYAMENGFDKIATGHYADIVTLSENGTARYALKQSLDNKKDQTYMLWRLPQDILSALIFPLSNEVKTNVRESAGKLNLSCADRDESQEICFIPDNDYPSFIEARAGKSEEGDFINNVGKVLGRHKGIIHYTVGQRKGLGVALGKRAFITEINKENNTITLDTEDSFCDCFRAYGTVFSGLKPDKTGEELLLEVKHRYLAPLTKARVVFGKNGDAFVRLVQPVRALTPGQSCVFYKEGVVMAGAFILGKHSE